MTSRPLADRFWEKVDVRSPSECWEWTASRGQPGYGRISKDRNTMLDAHRVSYELNVGAIPEGKRVLHSCHNRGCVNPNHLRVGTAKDNSQDMVKAGRSSFGNRKSSVFLSPHEVKAIRVVASRHKRWSGVQSFLADWFGTSKQVINKIVNGTHWKYLEGGTHAHR